MTDVLDLIEQAIIESMDGCPLSRDGAKAVLHALREAGALAEWRGIESAPKTPADLSKTISILGWCPDSSAPDGGDWRVVWWEPRMRGGIWFGDRDLEEHPTAWMPLPTPLLKETDDAE